MSYLNLATYTLSGLAIIISAGSVYVSARTSRRMRRRRQELIAARDQRALVVPSP